MRTILFLLSVIVFIGLGVYLFFQQPLGSDQNDLLNNPNAIKNKDTLDTIKILPVEKWNANLIGKWKFTSRTEKSDDRIITFTGEVEYFRNGEFKRYITNNIFPFDRASRADFIAGGSVIGKWKVIDSLNYWIEQTLQCKIKPTKFIRKYKNLNPCRKYFPKTKEWTFGDFENDYQRNEIEIFNKNLIRIKETTYDQGGNNYYEFSRISE